MAPVVGRVGWVKRFLLNRRTAATRFLAMTEEAGESLVAAGYPAEWIERVEPPSIPALVRGVSRRPLRMRWGAAGENETVALLIGLEGAGAEGLLTSALGLGLARETGRSLRLLVPPGAAGLERLRRMLDSASRSRVVIVDEAADDPAEAAPAADLAIVLADSIALPWAAAAGLAMIAADTKTLRRVLPGDGALWFPAGSSGKIAQHAAKLADSTELRARLGGQTRAAMADRCSPRRVLNRLSELYESMGVRMSPVGAAGSDVDESTEPASRRA
jgi:hypothetical protein